MKRLLISMKRLLIPLSLLLILGAVPTLAAECGEVVPSDGNGCRECALGDLGADALRAETRADIALFPAGDLGISLLPGPITENAVADSFPADRPIVTAELTRAELTALLEAAVSAITLDANERLDEAASASDGFLCVSGFTFSYDASAPAGDRIYDLDAPDRMTAAAPEGLFAGETAGTIRQAVTAYCEGAGTVLPPEGGRIRVLGAQENYIVGGLIPRSFIIVVAAVALLFGGARYRRRLRAER